MDVSQIGIVLQEAVSVILKLSMPMLLLSMAVGVVIAIVQAVTQIHEQSIGFVFKLIIVVLILVMGGEWMLRSLQEYALELFALM